MTEELRVALGRVLRFQRIRLGFRQEDVARRAGLDRGRVSLIERGRVDLQLSTLERLAAALDRTAEDLLAAARAEAEADVQARRRHR